MRWPRRWVSSSSEARCLVVVWAHAVELGLDLALQDRERVA